MSADTRDEALRALIQEAIEESGRGGDVWLVSKIYADKIAALAAPVEAAPPAGAVEDAWTTHMDSLIAELDKGDGPINPLATPATRQYYYRVNACKAANQKAPDCLCWHDEGTGPLADTPERIREWRTKPAARQGGESFDEASIRAETRVDHLRSWALCMMRERDAALAARPAAGDGEWLPMDEAPRDGTIIVCRYEHHPVRPAMFDGEAWVTWGAITESGPEPTGWRPLAACEPQVQGGQRHAL